MLIILKKTGTGFTNEEKKAFIEFKDSKLSVKHQCELLSLPRPTAYHIAVESQAKKREIDIKNATDRIHFKEAAFGVRNLSIVRPNQVWSIDISYVGTPTGFVYITTIIDWILAL